VAGFCERDNESSGSIKCGEFLDWLRTCLPLKDSAPCSDVSHMSDRNGNGLALLGGRVWCL
jgi:hypothetical protein